MLLALVELDGGTVAGGSAAALAFTHAVAGELGESVEALVIGPDTDGTDDTAITAELAKLGVARLHRVKHELLDEYAAECCGEALAQLIGQLSPAGVVAAATDRGNELLAHAAARSGLPLATGCIQVRPGGELWTLTRIRGGGVLLEDAELHAPTKLVTVAPGATEPVDVSPVHEVEVSTFTPDFAEVPVHGRLVDRTASTSGVALATARVVVSGGRGVGSAEGFAVLEQLADLLGGAVGCSRVATNNGWRPHSDQVGLTGTRITPALYVACGISGATQHWVGCMDAKTILAINMDSEAPMVTRAAYAVIGDVHQILPAVIDEIRRRAGTS